MRLRVCEFVSESLLSVCICVCLSLCMLCGVFAGGGGV